MFCSQNVSGANLVPQSPTLVMNHNEENAKIFIQIVDLKVTN